MRVLLTGADTSSGSSRMMLPALGLLSSSAVLATIFSVLTNKLIALHSGPEGIALMGLYRGLGSWVTGALTLGFGVILTQRMAAARSKAEADAVLCGSYVLFCLQFCVVLVTACFLARPLTSWLFQAALPGQVLVIRLVLAMALVNLALQMITALLRGQQDVGPTGLLQVATACASLAMIYPLLKLGDQGLAVNVGSGGLIGVPIGLVFIWKVFHPSLHSGVLSRGWRFLKSSMTHSLWLILSLVITSGCLLAAQSVVNKGYGLEALGSYNAALLIVDMGVMILMSSARTYILPALGRIDDPKQMAIFFSRSTGIVLLLTIPAGVVLAFAAPYLMWALFSSKFLSASQLLPIFGVSIVGQAVVWSFNTFLLHKGDIRSFVLIDVSWAVLLLATVSLCVWMRLPLASVAWAHALSWSASGLLYVVFTRHAYGSGLMSPQNGALALGGAAWLALGGYCARIGLGLGAVVFLAATFAGLILIGGRQNIRDWARQLS